ncbi:MAG: hypothetical protein GY725_09605 [bacterium]|nr:hypothetical protein [bacterium]
MIDARTARRLSVALRSGLRGTRETPFVFLVSVATMAGGLLVLAGYLLIVQNMRGVLERFGEDLRIVAFLVPGETPDKDAVAAFGDGFRALEGVARVQYISPDKALGRLRSELGEDAAILEDLDHNPLPGSFELVLADDMRSPENARRVAASAGATQGIDEVRYGEDWVAGYARTVRVAEWLGLGLGLVLLMILSSIVAGTVRLAVHTRSDEIQVQRLVGARGFFVRLPFYLEGALQGASAAALALLALYGLFVLGLPLLGAPLEFLLGDRPVEFFDLGGSMGLLLLGTGMGLGGAVLSLTRLDERT